jgi:HSP20 family protein
MSRFFGGLLRRLSEGQDEADSEPFPIDVDEDDTNLYVDAELPGFAKDEVDIRLEPEVLSIRAERMAAEPRGRRRVAERRTHHVRRTFPLPEPVDLERAEASLCNGVLHLTLPKSKRPQRNRIEIR